MEYIQMTLNDWLDMKQSLEKELNNMKTGFVRVGYFLRRIEESRGYEQDGYKSVAEFAKEEYGLSASTVSRFMAINARFSLGGYSERLDPKYMGFHQSIMGELLGLPEKDLELVTPETSRQDVRDLKQFNRQEPAAGIADDLKDLIENYFRENRQELIELYSGSGQTTKEILNPSGNKVYRKGMYMLFFYADCVRTKKFGGAPEIYSWDEFRELIDGVYGSSAVIPGLEEKDNSPKETDSKPENTVNESEKRDTLTVKAGEEEKKEDNLEERDAAAGSEEDSEVGDVAAEGYTTEETETEGEPEGEPADSMSAPEHPEERPEPIAPAQKPKESQTYTDVKKMLKGIEESFRKKDWERMLRIMEGMEPAIRKLMKEDDAREKCRRAPG